MALPKFKPAQLLAFGVAVLLPAVMVFASEMMSQGRANSDHVFGTLLVAMGAGVIALAATWDRGDRAALLAHTMLGIALLVQGYASVGAVRPQLRQPLGLVSMALMASFLFWNIRRRLSEHR